MSHQEPPEQVTRRARKQASEQGHTVNSNKILKSNNFNGERQQTKQLYDRSHSSVEISFDCQYRLIYYREPWRTWGVGAWNFDICVPCIWLENMRARICIASYMHARMWARISYVCSHIVLYGSCWYFLVVGLKSVSPSSVRSKHDPYKLTPYH